MKIDFTEMTVKLAEELDLRPGVVLAFIKEFFTESFDKDEALRKWGLPETHLIRLVKAVSQMPVGKILDNPSKNIKEILEKYGTLRPKPDREYDQFTATDETTINRGRLLAEKNDLWERNILFLGDDDLTSVAAAATGLATKITVVEIDERWGNFIKKISKENELKIEVIGADLRENLPEGLANNYDVVFTDPPYTPDGATLFLNQALVVLKKKLTSRVYFCYGNSDRARERELKIQQILAEMGWLINEKRYQFNQYHGARSIGSNSSLYLLDWTPQTRKKAISNEQKIYTNE
jgi:N4-bis(aminopropyl)spermidine synthase